MTLSLVLSNRGDQKLVASCLKAWRQMENDDQRDLPASEFERPVYLMATAICCHRFCNHAEILPAIGRN